jgi:hypothetical protein
MASAMTTHGTEDQPRNGAGRDDVADKVEQAVDRQPWLESVTRLGWAAKGAVYALMGLTAYTIGRHRPTADDASPEGAMAQVVTNPGGLILLAVLAIGLVLYSAWRVLTVLLITGHGPKEWAERVGYTFSAAFYAILAFTAVSAVSHGDTPQDSNTVEQLSQRLLESNVGRWGLLVGGVVTFAIGVYFVIQKGARRSFCDDLDLVGASATERRSVEITGVVGWVSRGLITCALGWFVIVAAWTVDQSEARGFDRSFRELADTNAGAIAVSAGGIALVVYGVFCVLSIRHLELEQ